MPRGEKAVAYITDPSPDTTTAWERLRRVLPEQLRVEFGRLYPSEQESLAEFVETERLRGAVQELLMMELVVQQFRFTNTWQVRTWLADRLKARERELAEREGSDHA
jgi:hypothetical protein